MIAMPKERLLLLLREMQRLIEIDDSFEGRVSYTVMLDEDDPVQLGPGEFAVEAVFRYGNSMGQGFCHMEGV